ncbi:hypothetical protein FSC37_13355 [Piscinibacter aquaticus]|uniref:Uncharacterized protein n=1 Tax=Piscinibacter aquaticus TaxID=392597 RepID=A0A5C6U397_9BURK|nr:hypothetical protein FSC37_13355 [Piscinibacter aquaticus]
MGRLPKSGGKFVCPSTKLSQTSWNAKELSGTKRKFVREHPTLMALSALAAFATPLALPNFPTLFALGMLVYGLSLFAAMLTRDPFIGEYSRVRLQTDQLVDHAFGIDKVSLLVFNSFDQKDLLDGVSQPDIGKLIKLVKAGHDYASTTYGYYDHVRKAFIAGLLRFR